MPHGAEGLVPSVIQSGAEVSLEATGALAGRTPQLLVLRRRPHIGGNGPTGQKHEQSQGGDGARPGPWPPARAPSLQEAAPRGGLQWAIWRREREPRPRVTWG